MPSKDPETRRKTWRDWYKRNSKSVMQRQKPQKEQRRIEKLKRWYEFKATLRCARCPENHLAALQFHHVSGKDANLSEVAAYWSWERLMREVAKCIVLCANCHAKEHWQEKFQGVAQLG
jgi:hypothetical protein